MLRKLVILAPLILFIAGCQTAPRHIPLDAKKSANIKLVQVVSMITQDEIIARSKPSYVAVAVGGGLLAAAVDSSITKSRMSELYNILEPAYASFDDVDMRAIFWPQLQEFMTQRARLLTENVTTTPWLITPGERAETMATMKEDAYLEMYTSYFFDPDLRTFNVITNTLMFSKNVEAATYRNTIAYQSPVIGSGMQDSMDKWTANNGELFRNALSQAADETIRQLEFDLGRQTVTPSKKPITLAYNTGTETIGRTGNILAQDDNRVILREKDGTLISLPNVVYKKPEPVDY